jgi:hypothetical protein
LTSCNCTRGLLSGNRIDHTGSAGGGTRTGVGKGKGEREGKTMLALGKIYPRPVPRSVSCGAGPLGSLARACPVLDWLGPADSHWELPLIVLVMGKIYPRPEPRSVSCEVGPPGSRARARPMLDWLGPADSRQGNFRPEQMVGIRAGPLGRAMISNRIHLSASRVSPE